MKEPIRVEWNCGRDAYNRAVKVVFQTTYDGKRVFSIHRAEANQRDEAEQVTGLTKQNILDMAAAVADLK